MCITIAVLIDVDEGMMTIYYKNNKHCCIGLCELNDVS